MCGSYWTSDHPSFVGYTTSGEKKNLISSGVSCRYFKSRYCACVPGMHVCLHVCWGAGRVYAPVLGPEEGVACALPHYFTPNSLETRSLTEPRAVLQLGWTSGKAAVGSIQPPVVSGSCDHTGFPVVIRIQIPALLVAQQGPLPDTPSPQHQIPVFLL